MAFLQPNSAYSNIWFRRRALQHHIFNATFFAKLTFFLRSPILIDYKDVGFQSVDRADEVHHPCPIVDESVFHVADSLNHEKTLVFGIECLVVFVMQDGIVGADADVKVAILRSLSKEFNVTTFQSNK